MGSNNKSVQDAYELVLKKAIRKNNLKVVSVEESSRLMMEYEQSRDPESFKEPSPPDHLPLFSMTATAHQSTDLLPGDEGVNPRQSKMFFIHRDEMRRWLKKVNEWPLAEDCLLSKWWRKTNGFRGNDASEFAEENYFRLKKDYWDICYGGRS